MSFEPLSQEFETAERLRVKCQRLERDLAREKAARREAETIAEHGLRELYLNREHLKLLNNIASFANDSDDPKEALEYATQQICLATGWAVGHALIRRGPAGDERLEGTDIWAAQNPDVIFPFIEASRLLVAWPCVSAPGRLFIEQSPIWTPDIHAQAAFSRSPAAERCGLRSGIAVPVLMGHELVGALEFYQADTIKPEPDFLEILMQIGTQIGRVFKRRRHADILRVNATTDALTGLPNRAAFETELHSVFGVEHESSDFRLSLIYMDLDGFKLVNDTLGHVAGDMLLMAMAERLRDVVDKYAALAWIERILLARIGGDEFVIMIRADGIEGTSTEIAGAIHKCLLPNQRIGANDVRAMASIGIAFNDAVYESSQELLRDADVAMYEAKSTAPGQTVIFSEQMRSEALVRLDLESDLRHAIETSAFELHYQPIVSIAGRALVGFEALVRWRRQDGEIVMPDVFIGSAEACGLIIPIGTWVLREACRAAGRLQSARVSATPIYVSVNVAIQQFQQLHFVELVRDILLETGADAKWIRLELTESSAVTNPAYAAQAIQQLRAMGVQVSLDDFGTGYSSLAHLQTMPFDTIKIDRSFVMKQTEADSNWSIVSAMKQLADSMGMAVIVEGVENEFQLAELDSLGCQFGQGWLFEKPMPEADALKLLALG